MSTAEFTVESVTLLPDNATIRVKYSARPLSLDPNDIHDALNSDNYSISGDGVNLVIGCASVYWDSTAIDIVLAGPLSIGTWKVLVSSAVVSVANVTISGNRLFEIESTGAGYKDGVAAGAENDDAEAALRKHLNPALRGRGWSAIMAGIAVGENYNRNNVQKGFDQLFKVSASASYLTKLALNDGLFRDESIGLDDEKFRQLSLVFPNNLLVEGGLLKILEVFYGVDAVRAHATSLAEPYDLADGDQLFLLIDEQTEATITFLSTDFTNISAATAIEVAAAITRGLRNANSLAYAIAVPDTTTGVDTVRIYSPSLGLSSSVRVTGGSAQNALQFPLLVDVYTDVAPIDWDLEFNTGTRVMRMTHVDNKVNLALLVPGDYVNIYGSSVNASNRGTFTITNISDTWSGVTRTQYIEFELDDGVDQLGYTQNDLTDFVFFRPERQTAFSSHLVSVTDINSITNVTIPATTRAIVRRPGLAAYVDSATAIDIESLYRYGGTVVVQAGGHGLTAGDIVMVKGAQVDLTSKPTTTVGAHASSPDTSDLSVASIWSHMVDTTDCRVYRHVVVADNNGNAFVLGGRGVSGGVDDAPSDAATATGQKLQINSLTQQTDYSVEVEFEYDVVDNIDRARAAGSRVLVGSPFEGQIVVTGGTDSTPGGEDSVYLLDPADSSITTLAVLNQGRYAHAQTSLADGRVMVFGGIESGVTALDSTEVSDVSLSFSTVTAAPRARAEHQQILLDDGRVLVVGGRAMGGSTVLDYTDPADIGTLYAECDIYDPDLDTWENTGPLTWARFQHRLVKLPDGRVLAIGGLGYNPTSPVTPIPVRAVEIWDPVTGRWHPAGRLAFDRETLIAEYLPGRNQVLVAGGLYTTATELLDVSTMKWSIGPATLPVARAFAQSCVLENDVVFIAGGRVVVAEAADDTDLENYLYIQNADTVSGGKLNGQYAVSSVIDPNNFTYTIPGFVDYDIDDTEYSALSISKTYALGTDGVGTITALAAPEINTPGPFIIDTDDGRALTDIISTTTSNLAAGHHYSTLPVVDATDFPDEPGWLVVALGTKYETKPVPYLGRFSDTALSIDTSFEWPSSIPSGANVIFINQKGPWAPEATIDLGLFYATGVAPARLEATRIIEESVASGTELSVTVTYPGDRGLGNEGKATSGVRELSDIVKVFGGDDLDEELEELRDA